jgi:hypothetical protein
MTVTMIFTCSMPMVVSMGVAVVFMVALVGDLHIVDILFAVEVMFLSMGYLTLNRSVKQFIFLSEHVSDSFEGLGWLVRRDVTSHTHLSSSKLPDMQVVITADGVAGI